MATGLVCIHVRTEWNVKRKEGIDILWRNGIDVGCNGGWRELTMRVIKSWMKEDEMECVSQ